MTIDAAAPAVAPTLATAWVMDGRNVKSEAPVLRSRAFQLTIEEPRVAPDVVTGMISYLSFYVMSQ